MSLWVLGGVDGGEYWVVVRREWAVLPDVVRLGVAEVQRGLKES